MPDPTAFAAADQSFSIPTTWTPTTSPGILSSPPLSDVFEWQWLNHRWSVQRQSCKLRSLRMPLPVAVMSDQARLVAAARPDLPFADELDHTLEPVTQADRNSALLHPRCGVFRQACTAGPH